MIDATLTALNLPITVPLWLIVVSVFCSAFFGGACILVVLNILVDSMEPKKESDAPKHTVG